MDPAAILQAVSSVGIPAVMCYLLWKHMTETTKDMQRTVNENTIAVARMTQLLEDLLHDDQ